MRGIQEGTKVYQAMADGAHAALYAGSDWCDAYVWAGHKTPDYTRIAWQGDRVVEKGDLVRMTVWATFNGRHAQLIRTGVRGKATAEQRRWVEVAKQLHEPGLALLRPGAQMINAVDAMQEAVNRLTPPEANPKPTRMGHLQGVQYTEPGDSDPFDVKLKPDLRPAAEKVIVLEGMRFVLHPVFTVPGIGRPGVGSNYLITASGPQLLDRLSQDCLEG
jgi:Xaa-Pro aminopeptidase